MFRRKGLAKKLLQIVEEKTKIKPQPQDPISPLGEKLFYNIIYVLILLTSSNLIYNFL